MCVMLSHARCSPHCAPPAAAPAPHRLGQGRALNPACLGLPPPASLCADEGTYDVNVLVAGRGMTGVSAIKAAPPREARRRPQH